MKPKESKLKAIEPKATVPTKPKILVFGRPGIGKTWWALDFPSVYYIDTEGGASRKQYMERLQASGGVYMGPEQDGQDFERVIEELKTLATEKHPYKTVVIDSLSKLYNIAIARELDRAGGKDNFGSSKRPATALTRRLISWIDRIDMNVILICHEKGQWEKQEQVGYTFDAWDKLEYELDLAIRVMKHGDKRIGNIRKSRLVGFPDNDSFTWNYAEFANRYGKDIIEKEAQAIELATDEQVSLLKKLVKELNYPEGNLEKWLARDKITEFEEMRTDRIAFYIEYLKKQKGNPAV